MFELLQHRGAYQPFEGVPYLNSTKTLLGARANGEKTKTQHVHLLLASFAECQIWGSGHQLPFVSIILRFFWANEQVLGA